jgi:hypothetical protein
MSFEDAWSLLTGVLADMQKSSLAYFERQFRGPLARKVYEGLFAFADCLKAPNAAQALLERLNLADGPALLPRFADTLCPESDPSERDERVTDTVRRCLDDFLLTAVNNNLIAFSTGDLQAVRNALADEMFRRRSGHFLGRLIWQVAIRDIVERTQTEEASQQIKTASFALGDRIIAAAEQNLFGKDKQPPQHRQLFDVLSEHWDWFRQEVRQ